MNTKEEMLAAIRAYFGDTSNELEETRDGLLEARDEIDTMLDAMKN